MSGSPLLERHTEAIDVFSSRVHAIRDDQWDAPTPCSEWTVRDLVNHLTGEQLWVVPLVEGRTLEEVGDAYDGDVLGDDPVATWDRAMTAARRALHEDGALDRTVHTSMGPMGASEYCSQLTADTVIHSWDLSRAIGADERLPLSLVDFALQELTPMADALRSGNLWAAPVPVGDDADAQTKLLAMSGRRA
ncbi:TIGR03086 family metal-binding protein [Streptomyces coeruleoprunus]|uniref:TIGR03086 family metal-binding protein n=1 Tax=Streptomyces coeruleoprunus TaxID=285563 RepID=A0ABV9XA72_9ACTN